MKEKCASCWSFSHTCITIRGLENIIFLFLLFPYCIIYLLCRLIYYLVYCYRDADKFLTRPTSGSILFDGENISFDASLVICINSTNIPPIMIINRIYENQNLLSL